MWVPSRWIHCADMRPLMDYQQQAARHPDANQQDMKAMVNRSTTRLHQYQLLMESLLKETPVNHDDWGTIPELLEAIKALGMETSKPDVVSAEQKLEMCRYNSNLVFKPGEQVVRHSLINANK
jgi:hypothetical protein